MNTWMIWLGVAYAAPALLLAGSAFLDIFRGRSGALHPVAGVYIGIMWPLVGVLWGFAVLRERIERGRIRRNNLHR
jgi:hypothetical protein